MLSFDLYFQELFANYETEIQAANLGGDVVNLPSWALWMEKGYLHVLCIYIYIIILKISVYYI